MHAVGLEAALVERHDLSLALCNVLDVTRGPGRYPARCTKNEPRLP